MIIKLLMMMEKIPLFHPSSLPHLHPHHSVLFLVVILHSCELTQQKEHNPQVKQSKALPEKKSLLSKGRCEAGDFVAADQFVVNTPWCFLSGFGHEDAQDDSMVVLSFKMLQLASHRLVSDVLLVTWSWQRNSLKNGSRRCLLLKLLICPVIMDHSLMMCSMTIARWRIRPRVSQVFKLDIKMLWPKQSSTWIELLWLIFLSIGLNTELMIWTCRDLE